MKTQPTQLNERIVSLDVLRGFAILGILVMNIQEFSMVGIAYRITSYNVCYTKLLRVSSINGCQ